ncbi:MAG: M15 family metallopeptidase [Oscillospiraceae bacterium]|nr:M15 family metallopeptidase [Oscillospiraceae bacterium]
MKKRHSAARIIGGILFTAVFIVFAYISCKVAVHSSDLENCEDTYLYRVYGYDRNRYLRNQGREDELEVDYTVSDETGEVIAIPAAAPAAAVVPEAVPSAEPVPVSEPVPTPDPTPAPTSEPTLAERNAAALGLPAPPDLDINDWQYVLVNGDHPLDPIDYAPANLVYLNMTGDDTDIRTGYDGNRQVVDAMIAQPLIDMTQACKAAGLPIYLSSGYRSYSEQAANFQRINANNGISDGKNNEGHYITMPAGCSEHQTALCCDITDYYHEIKNDAIAQLPTVQWLAEHCADYGFILRFPTDKRDITHVMGESWHFRYVGVEAAKYMTENNLCLEEFVALYT